ncbi:hypothetical protein SESBI_05543 [Sesbania bispinosa]|nr:hypothetical protein SESBI_05543 [Sesbania bispinosa]
MELSLEEQDLLTWSTKKPKVGEDSGGGDEEVPQVEIEMGGGDGGSPSAKVEMVNMSDKLEDVVQVTELFETVTGEAMKRNLVSYKDALGVNGGYNSGSSSGSEYELSSKEGESEEDEDSSGEEEVEDRLCPVIKLSKEERHEACRPWRKALIVKLLGKRVGLRFLHLRLIKLWHPVGEMESTPMNQNKPAAAPYGGESSEKGQAGEDAFGPWMLVGRQRRRQPNNLARGSCTGSGAKLHDAVKGNVADPNGSRFDVLMEDCMEENNVEQEQVNTVSSSVEKESIVSSKVPREVKEGTCHKTQNMEVDGLKMGHEGVSISEFKEYGNSCPDKDNGPKSLREIKSTARGKNNENGPSDKLGLIEVPQEKAKQVPNLKGKVVISGSADKENIGPKSDIVLRPNYKRSNAPFRDKEIVVLKGISTGPGVIVGNWRPPDDGLRGKELIEATESGGFLAPAVNLGARSVSGPRDALWVKVLRHKYGAGSDIVPLVKKRANTSDTWRSICKVWEHVESGMKWMLGNGLLAKFWKDAWLFPGVFLKDYLLAELPESDLILHVAHFVSANGEWCLSLFDKLLPEFVIEFIIQHAPPRPSNVEDFPSWVVSSGGSFSSRSAYSLLTNESETKDLSY